MASQGVGELNKYLKEIGLTYEQLNEDEKGVFEQWIAIFEKEITVENITAFMAVQIKELTDDLLEAIAKGDQVLINLYAGRIQNYKDVLLLIDGPAKAKGAVREQLDKIISRKK